MSSSRCLALLLLLFSVASLKAQSFADVVRVATVELADGYEALEFENVDISLGKISEDDNIIEGRFSFTNVGKAPLVLTRVVTSCSCLVVSYPKQPVKVGEQGEITFQYHPRGFPGSLQRKIFVYTNLSQGEPTAVLEVTGYVEKSSDETINYRYSMSDLYLKQKGVSFKDGRRVGVERINCYNAGDVAMKLKSMAGFLPDGLSFSTEPEVIPPRTHAELVIRHDPNVWSGVGAAYKIIVDGLSGKPSQRSIDVKFEYKNN